MTYFDDLSEYRYFEPEAGVLNVGWLGEGQPFQTGETSEAFRAALNELCKNNSINHCFGHHVCEFCQDASWGDRYYFEMGNGEIRVRDADGIWYVAPRLVIHYVVEHNYCPPQAFIEAVLNPSEVGKYPERIHLSEEEETARIREDERRRRELGGPPITETEIDQIVKRGIREARPRKPRWRFW